MDSDALARRLFATITATLSAYACAQPSASLSGAVSASAAPSADAGAVDLPLQASASSTASTSPTSGETRDTEAVPTSTNVASATPSATPPARTCRDGAKLETYCIQAGTRPPQIMKAPSPMPPVDANGCVAANQVLDSCNGVSAVLSGPAAKNRQCCYQVCRGQPAPCGRPLMVGSDTEGRVASLKVPVFMASALADAWLADALLEHASVASFARFTMELLAVGAPLDMIADAQKAGLDEVAHAEACFELAHAHAPLHPKAAAGPLSLRELTIRDSLAEVAAAAVIEGCCGETVAALALARASAFCTNPRTKAILAQIAEDEARHAELAFRFVAWAVATGADEVRSAVRLAFERERSSLVTACEAPLQTDASDEARGWRSAGRLTDRDLADVRREAANLLLEPAAKLLGQSESYIC